MQQNHFYVLSDIDADRLSNLTRAFTEAICDLLSARRQVIASDDYDHHEMSVYELEHRIKSSTRPDDSYGGNIAANEFQLNVLYRTPSKRWALNGCEISAGTTIEVNIQGQWISVTVEHDGHDYIAIPASVRLHIGLLARLQPE